MIKKEHAPVAVGIGIAVLLIAAIVAALTLTGGTKPKAAPPSDIASEPPTPTATVEPTPTPTATAATPKPTVTVTPKPRPTVTVTAQPKPAPTVTVAPPPEPTYWDEEVTVWIEGPQSNFDALTVEATGSLSVCDGGRLEDFAVMNYYTDDSEGTVQWPEWYSEDNDVVIYTYIVYRSARYAGSGYVEGVATCSA